MAAGAFRLWTADQNGNPLLAPNTTATTPQVPDPSTEQAVDIYFAPLMQPPDDQAKLQEEVSYVLSVVTRLYLGDDSRANKTKFRRYYVRIFRLAQVGLEGSDPSPKQAKVALDGVKASLMDDEGLVIKTRNLTRLGETALALSLPFAIAYFVLTVVGKGDIEQLLTALQVENIKALANFMLLWIGCFTGVCLSYGVRTSTLTLGDLVSTGADRLAPGTRLLFIGTITMLFGLLFVNGIVELKIGPHSTAQIATHPALAFIVGTLFGLSESVLPGLAGKRAEALLKGLMS